MYTHIIPLTKVISAKKGEVKAYQKLESKVNQSWRYRTHQSANNKDGGYRGETGLLLVSLFVCSGGSIYPPGDLSWTKYYIFTIFKARRGFMRGALWVICMWKINYFFKNKNMQGRCPNPAINQLRRKMLLQFDHHEWNKIVTSAVLFCVRACIV